MTMRIKSMLTRKTRLVRIKSLINFYDGKNDEDGKIDIYDGKNVHGCLTRVVSTQSKSRPRRRSMRM